MAEDSLGGFGSKYPYPEQLPEERARLANDTNGRTNEETDDCDEEEEEQLPDFLSNQEFLRQASGSNCPRKEGRAYIEGGGHFQQREHGYNDLIQELLLEEPSQNE